MSNVSVATFRTWKGNTTAPADAVVQAAIDAAEEAINDDCGRVFAVAGDTPSARLYVPTNDDVLTIHDCVAVSSITEDGSAVTLSYQLEPVNNLTAAGDYSPYTRVRLLGSSWRTTGERGEATISVSARWGWAALPDRYISAVEILAADLLEQRELRNGIVGFTEYAGIRVKANPMVAGLLSKLRRAEAWGIA